MTNILGALLVLSAGRRPQTAMAWVILIAVLPLVGFVLFLLFGRTSVDRERRAQQVEVTKAIIGAEPAGASTDDIRVGRLPHFIRGFNRLNRHLAGLPMTFGNRLDLLPNYRDSIRAMTQEVATAEGYGHVQFYITAWEEVTAPFTCQPTTIPENKSSTNAT